MQAVRARATDPPGRGVLAFQWLSAGWEGLMEYDRPRPGRVAGEKWGYTGGNCAPRANSSAETGPSGISTAPPPAAAHAQVTLAHAASSAGSVLPHTTHVSTPRSRRTVTIPAAVPTRTSRHSGG